MEKQYFEFVSDLYAKGLLRITKVEAMCEISPGTLAKALKRGQTTFTEADKLKAFFDFIQKASKKRSRAAA